jgi:site-specific recombinase XerD
LEARSLSVFQLIDSWRLYLLGRNFAAGTLRVYGSKLKAYARYIEFTAADPLSIDFHFLEAWIRHLRQEEKTWKTIHDHLTAVHSLYHHLKREALVPCNPVDDLDPIKLEEKLPDWWSEGQVRKVIAGARTTRNRAILEALYSTGGRADEVQQIDVDGMQLGERSFAVIVGKGRREEILHLMPEAARAIEAWLPERAELLRQRMREHEPALFVSALGRRLSYFPFRNVVVQAAAAAGVEGPAHPHMFRHSIATHLLDRQVDLRQVQEFLRHRSLTSTQRYTHVAQERLRSTLMRAHPRAGGVKPDAP